ncbi:MAG: hypothetical protein ACXACG_06205 [Candidatus Thorarchaeota archaeon]|jgi:sulfur carrier protein ThiS
MIQIFIKLLNRGLRSSEYDKFPYQVRDKSSITHLIDGLMSTHGEEFEVYLENKRSRNLRKDVVVIVNGRIIVSGWKLNMRLIPESILDTEFQDGDTVAFMIVVGGG